MCASLNLNKKSGRGGLGERAQRLPPKADWKHLFSHARCWVECDTQVKVYILHDMHLGNMWNVD